MLPQAAPRWSALRTRYYDSATSALAVAVADALADRGAAREVRLPAYACPNLAAAVEYAGARPQFVDFGPTGVPPTLDQMVAGGVGVAVDFCGIPSTGTAPAGDTLIHDLAQSYAPFMPAWRPLAARTVVSFGRAKPVSLTRGGALLGGSGGAPASRAAADGMALRAQFYNLSLHPLVFGVLARLPFLGIGTTAYQPLREVHELGERFAQRVDAAIAGFRARRAAVYEGTRRALEFATDAGLTLPFDAAALPAGLPLWRVPVTFADPAAALHFAEQGARFGVSRLYQKTLPEILGVAAEEARQRWPEAWRLSRTLVTLPTHDRLDADDWRRLRKLAGAGDGA